MARCTHSFQQNTRYKIFAGAFIAWLVGWLILAHLEGQLPYFDSINFVVSLIAQLLYILKYKENWSLWIVVNIANLAYWSILSVQMAMGQNEIYENGRYLIYQTQVSAVSLLNYIS